jgi:hypothetical protein
VLYATGETTGGHFFTIEHAMPPGLISPYHTHHNEDVARRSQLVRRGRVAPVSDYLCSM